MGATSRSAVRVASRTIIMCISNQCGVYRKTCIAAWWTLAMIIDRRAVATVVREEARSAVRTRSTSRPVDTRGSWATRRSTCAVGPQEPTLLAAGRRCELVAGGYSQPAQPTAPRLATGCALMVEAR